MTPHAPVVSIVMPTYRRPEFLRDSLASALRQTHRDLEVLVCDNGGDDETARVIADAADERVVHVRRESDIGMFANALDGFRRARGEFVVKLDDDDRLYPTMVSELLAGFVDDDVTLSFAPPHLMDAQGEILAEATARNDAHSGRDRLTPGRHQPFEGLVARGAVSVACALIRRSAVDWDAVPDAVATAYDRHIALQAARHGAAAWYVDHPLAAYRVHAASDSFQAATRQALGSLHATESAYASGEYADPDALLTSMHDGAIITARNLIRDGRSREAVPVVTRALRRTPTDRALARLALLSLLPPGLAARIATRRLHRYEQARQM